MEITKTCYTREDIQKIMKMGRAAATNLMKSGQFHAVLTSRGYRVSKDVFDEWLENRSKQ